MPWAALVGAGSQILGGMMGKKSAGKAGSAQKKAGKKAMKEQKKMYEQSRRDMQPYMDSGVLANNNLDMRMGLAGDKSDANYGFLMKRFNNQEFEKDPGYQWRKDEGNRGISATQAARGGLLSGAAAKEAARYNQGYASNEYQNAYNRFTGDQDSQYNKLSGIKSSGQNAATSLLSVNMKHGDDMAEGYNNLGNIKAQTIGAKNEYNQDMLGGMNKLFQQGMADKKAERQASNYKPK